MGKANRGSFLDFERCVAIADTKGGDDYLGVAVAVTAVTYGDAELVLDVEFELLAMRIIDDDWATEGEAKLFVNVGDGVGHERCWTRCGTSLGVGSDVPAGNPIVYSEIPAAVVEGELINEERSNAFD